MLIDASGQIQDIHYKDMESLEVFIFKMIDGKNPGRNIK